MANLLVIVFLIQLLIHLINTIGATAINDLLWKLYSSLPHTSEAVKTQTTLRGEVVRLKREMAATSSQDEFAKWARLRRQHDKAMAEYDEKSSKVNSTRSKFDTTVTVARWLSTNGLRLFLQFWYSRTPIFYLPSGWFPTYMEWLVAFPRAPWGTVSIQVWGTACITVITLVGEALTAGVTWVGEQQMEKKRKQREKIKMAMEVDEKSPVSGEKKAQ